MPLRTGFVVQWLETKLWRPLDSWPQVLTSSLMGGLRDDIIVPNSGGLGNTFSSELMSPVFGLVGHVDDGVNW